MPDEIIGEPKPTDVTGTPKAWYSSKTLWAALLLFIGQLAALAQGGITSQEFMGHIFTFVGVVAMVVLRLLTKQPLE